MALVTGATVAVGLACGSLVGPSRR
jgi:hypothetical protein